MKATPYSWAMQLIDTYTPEEHVESEAYIESEAQEIVTEQFSSETVTLIVQLVEKLIDLTITNSSHAAQVTLHLLKQMDTL
jgi:hypothetical protein